MFGFLRRKKVVKNELPDMVHLTNSQLENLIRCVVRELLVEFLGEPKKPTEVPPTEELVVIPRRRGRKLGSKNKPRKSDYTPAQTPPRIPSHFSWSVTLRNRDTGIITNTTIDGVSEEAINKTVETSMGKTHEIISIDPKDKND